MSMRYYKRRLAEQQNKIQEGVAEKVAPSVSVKAVAEDKPKRARVSKK